MKKILLLLITTLPNLCEPNKDVDLNITLFGAKLRKVTYVVDSHKQVMAQVVEPIQERLNRLGKRINEQETEFVFNLDAYPSRAVPVEDKMMAKLTTQTPLASYPTAKRPIPAKHLTPIAKVYICGSRSAYAYHRYQCRGLSRCRSGISNVTVSEARSMGYVSCKICY